MTRKEVRDWIDIEEAKSKMWEGKKVRKILVAGFFLLLTIAAFSLCVVAILSP